MNQLELQEDGYNYYNGWYCEDCDKIFDRKDWGNHNANHIVKRIIWRFLK